MGLLLRGGREDEEGKGRGPTSKGDGRQGKEERRDRKGVSQSQGEQNQH